MIFSCENGTKSRNASDNLPHSIVIDIFLLSRWFVLQLNLVFYSICVLYKLCFLSKFHHPDFICSRQGAIFEHCKFPLAFVWPFLQFLPNIIFIFMRHNLSFSKANLLMHPSGLHLARLFCCDVFSFGNIIALAWDKMLRWFNWKTLRRSVFAKASDECFRHRSKHSCFGS